jgi:hypothetical protein
MRNIHLLPTDKPSRLYLHSNNELQLRTNIIRTSEDYLGSNQNIYITNNEEIKEGDWVYCRTENRVLISNVSYSKLDDRFKIILTTDPQLIADNVQAIDDKFLEWFVKNPSCESVEVKKGFADGTVYGYNFLDYKIIIPQEEPKHTKVFSENGNELFFDKQGNLIKEEVKQETAMQELIERLKTLSSKYPTDGGLLTAIEIANSLLKTEEQHIINAVGEKYYNENFKREQLC